MSKTETPAKLEQRKAKEAKELKKWQKALAKPTPAHYFGILIVVLTIIYIADEITSHINSDMQPQILFDLFQITSQDVNDPAYAGAINTMAIVSVFSMVFIFLAPFYKSLCDRFGRRPFLALNTLIFGVGLLIVLLCPNIYVYLIGVIVLGFVTPNDLQVMYIMEVAPKQHRAKLCSITKSIALISVSLIGVMRTAFMTDELSSWRRVYIIPVIVALTVAVIAFAFVRETPVFIHKRMKYLQSTDEERAAEARAKKEADSAAKGGVINALKFIFAHKQIRSVALAGAIFASATAYTNYHATIMEGGMSTEAVSIAIIVYPLANGIITFFSGFISDHFGRKKSCMVLGTLAMVGLAAFILACNLGWGPIPAGIFYGVSIGGLWSMSDMLFLTIPGESVPTEIRASVMGSTTLLVFVGGIVGAILIVVGQNFFPMGWLCFVICGLFMLASLIILGTMVHETKDVDLDTVTGTEWD